MTFRVRVWPLLLAAMVLATTLPASRCRQLRNRADPEPTEPVSKGAQADTSKMDGQKDLLAKTLLGIADQIEGKSKGSSESEASEPERKAFSDAVLKAVKVLGKSKSKKETLEQVDAALMKDADGNHGVGKSKVTVGQLVEALRLPPLKPKKPPVDKKKLLATAVSAVEAKLDQLSDMLADSKQENMQEEADKTAEEEASLDMQHGLMTAAPLGPPINFRLDMGKPELPVSQ